MANTVFNNVVIESLAKDLLTTKVNARSLMTIDNSLSENAGMKKTINTYTYTGVAESLGVGVGNTAATIGSISYVGKDYTVNMLQQQFNYQDEDVMKDPQIVEMMVDGATQVMANKLTADFYTAAATATVTHAASAFSYDEIVDAIAKLNLEDESALFLLVNNEGKAELRKDDDYKVAHQGDVVYNGQVGTIAGIPVICSKAVPADTAYLMTPAAIKCFMKKDVESESERDANTRTNKNWLRTAYVVALVDATKICKITY